MSNVIIDEYAPVKREVGKRAIIVVDRGWVFAGDVTRKDRRITLTNAVWLFRWESVWVRGGSNRSQKGES